MPESSLSCIVIIISRYSVKKWYETISIAELAEMIKAVVMSENRYMNILSEKESMLLRVEGAIIHINKCICLNLSLFDEHP